MIAGRKCCLVQTKWLSTIFGNVTGKRNSYTSSSGGSSSQKDESKNREPENESQNELAENMDMIRKVTTMMNKMNSINDPRINLLQAEPVKYYINY